MNEYNERWTREKHIEYRKLKRSGYSFEQLKEHFGDDIFYSSMFNKNGRTLPFSLKDYNNFIKDSLNEIKINPSYVYYNALPQESIFFKGETDYIISFLCNDTSYVLSFMYFPINNVVTYNIVFTTRIQWDEFNKKIYQLLNNGSLTDDDYILLNNIITKETNLNEIYPLFKNITYIIMDFYNKNMKGEILSIIEGFNESKIEFYRNIIRNSFNNITENEIIFNDEKYFIYKIK